MAGRPKVKKSEVIRLRAKGWTLQRIADRFGVSRSAIFLALSRLTCRVNHPRTPKPCRCGCGRLHLRRTYATRACYEQHVMRTKPFVECRYGCILARRVVAQVFPLEPQHVVHHEDRDQRHNDLQNLWVFEAKGDHIS